MRYRHIGEGIWPFFLVFIFLTMPGVVSPRVPAHSSDRQVVMRAIHKMERDYEQRRLSAFMGLFSRGRFPNLIGFRRAVENDFNTNTNIALRRNNEYLSISKSMAVYQAMWTKQYRPLMVSPHERRRLRRISGNVRIYFEKERESWKVINIQGYPIFGL